MFDENRMRSSYEHRAILAIVARVEGNAINKTIRFDVVLIDSTFEPCRVHRLCIDVGEMAVIPRRKDEQKKNFKVNRKSFFLRLHGVG